MLTRPHLAVMKPRRRTLKTPDPSLLEGVVSPRVLDAMHAASGAMVALGVRHLVVGGLAVGANGYPRATADVDFLVGDEAFEHHAAGIVTMRVPVQVNGVAVDCLSVASDEGHLLEALTAAPGSFATAPVLIYLKLKSPRFKDRADIVELVKAGIDVEQARRYLLLHAPQFVEPFDELVRTARSED